MGRISLFTGVPLDKENILLTKIGISRVEFSCLLRIQMDDGAMLESGLDGFVES